MENSLIYVAGNPDCYPLEYYDPDSGDYQGVIPELLRRFAQETGCRVQYYEPGRTDRRTELMEQQQVDLVFAAPGERFSHTEGELIPVLTVERDGTETAYGLYCSDVAAGGIRSELAAFLSGVSQEARTGLLLESAETGAPGAEPLLTAAVAGLGVTAALLLAVLLVTARRFRRKLRWYEARRETDEETGLGNREHLRRRFPAVVTEGNRTLYHLFCFHFDMARLARLNGPGAAMDVVRRGAALLREAAAADDLLARIGEGEFAFLRLSENHEEQLAWLERTMAGLRKLVEEAGCLDGAVAAGVCPLKAEDRDLEELLFRGVQCAREACAAGEVFRLCREEQERRIQEERQFLADVRRGLEQGEFLLYLQFYVDAQTFRVVGAEALTRWNHPQRGFLTPDRFVPLMEQEGIIHLMDHNSLKRVCDFLEELWRQGVGDFFISCNFSRKTFGAADFVEQCTRVLEEYHFPRELLIFEMTESAQEGSVGQMRQNAIEMKQLGVRIALDDFGEGFTSFYDLQEYPVDGIKLDKSLIDNIGTQKGDAILNAMVRVSHELGLTILAEGVETDRQVEALQGMGCDVIQGYRFSYPVPDWDARKQIMSWTDRQGGEGRAT